MDALESARIEAEKLHHQAIHLGGSITQPLKLATDEVTRRGLELCPVPEDDPQLKGGHALYDSQAGVILYTNTGSDFEKAFLISHEIAHIVLEDHNSDFVALNVEPSRPLEAPAVGAERLLDYGSRERKEVTMDIFAREFLLPRSVLRNWHIQMHATSGDIAEQTGAHLAVVQQQLLDALLLPLVPAPDQPAPKPNAPDESQVLAANHRGTPFQLQAGPGTGKTSTLVHRVLGLLDEGVDPASILVLTFSNKAATELRERISVQAPQVIPTLWIGTFHSFGLDIIHRFGDRLGYDDDPMVIGHYEAIELLEHELARLPLKHFQNYYDPTWTLHDMLNAISRAKDEVVDAQAYRALAQSMLSKASDDAEQVQAEKCLEVAMVYEIYEGLLKAKNSLDFGDLVLLPATLVESDAEVRRALMDRHQHILVDEYQDVNRASVRLLKGIADVGERLWVVGDSRQSIYRFRGASSVNMKRFMQDFPGAQAKQLETNYRSVEEIISLYTKFSQEMVASQGALPLSLAAFRQQAGVRPEFRIAGQPDDEIAAIAAAIKEKSAEGFSYAQQAILCTSNARLSDIAEALERQDIPVLYLGSLFERPEIRELLAILSLLVDHRAQGLVQTARRSGMAMTIEDVQSISRYIQDNNLKAMDWSEYIDQIHGLTDSARESAHTLVSALDGFSSASSPWSVLASLVIDRLGIAKEIAESTEIQKRLQGVAIWQLLNFSRRKLSSSGFFISALLQRIRRIVQLSEDRELRHLPQAAIHLGGVRLMTIHASKGLEFDVVHLPGLITTGLPGKNLTPGCLPPDGLIAGSEGLTGKEAIAAGHEEEEECKFFVASSRARDRLILYASSKQANGWIRNPSIYISRIDDQIVRSDDPPLSFPIAQRAQIITTDRNDGDLIVSERDIDQYTRCPRRFLYTRELSLGGRRVQSAFTQMHSVVYDVIGWLNSEFPEENPMMGELTTQFDSSWESKGPTGHAYNDHYRDIGFRFVEFLHESRRSKHLIQPEEIQLPFSDGIVTILPDEVSRDSSGRHKVTKINSGKLGSKEFDKIEYTLLLEAAEQRFGKGTEVGAIHLTGETESTAVISAAKRKTRIEKSNETVSKIAHGQYPAIPSTRTCPTCPNFFICGQIPPGTISIEK